MITGKGTGVFAGTAIGKVFLYKKQILELTEGSMLKPEEEAERFRAAKETSREQLQALYEKTVADIGEEEAMIIDVQLMMLDDMDFEEGILDKIENQGQNVAKAVCDTGEEMASMFAAMDDAYMKARAVDVRDISRRVAMNAQGLNPDPMKMKDPVVIVAEDLAPSETVQFDKTKILAFVTEKGSANSHTAILARTMNIPSIVNADIDLSADINGCVIIVDGTSGTYYLNPDEILLEKSKKKQEEELEQRALLQEMKGKVTVTLTGQKLNLYSNIGSVEDIDYVLENDSEGIGLFRSEFLYLGREDFPTEEEQFESYKIVAEKMNPKKVIIRTLDIGADKQADYFHLDKEENPAMGVRAIRICLTQMNIFRTQLRAIYRAAAFGNISIMFPMIISVREIQMIKEVLNKIKAELTEEGIPFGEVEIGVMIETPAAVMISDDLAKEVDFFSVGTNDLTQYTLAIDRQNQKLDNFYDSHHPAVLRMLKMIVDNAHANGIWAGICGELASDLTLTETFLKMGYDELSVSPTFTLGLRKKIRETSL